MSVHVYRKVEITGSSPDSSDDAVRRALEAASGDIGPIEWFEVTETRGHVNEGKISHWQVTIKAGSRFV
ncbi:dodecin [Burkholderia sp. L27(2015)]|uniref:dodecin n=1 Tax=Burkholderia sp. L27(2015) TaxID=1641858 RepID=UPI00131CBD9B|nr:dodecin [Burkholderia sp. L27(2015)]